jgi:hypothetical protein
MTPQQQRALELAIRRTREIAEQLGVRLPGPRQ